MSVAFSKWTRRGKHLISFTTLAIMVALAGFPQTVSAQESDFGAGVQHQLDSQSERYFGFNHPLPRPANATDYVPRESATAGDRVLLAKGLKAEFVTRRLAVAGDMIAFWPDAAQPTHLVVCIEQGRAAGGINPGVQRVELATGNVATILFGTTACDGIRTTPWGTVLATEETTTGRAYEILDPINTTGHWIADRATGDIRTAVNGGTQSTTVVQRQALPTMAWEGLAILPSGVVIAGDELRPGPGDTDGGAIFKFIPDSPSGGGKISSLSQSPLAAGKVYAMSLSCQPISDSNFPQFGQGCEIGTGAWVRVNALTARGDARTKGATGYYRPEDLHADPAFTGPGVRFCWTNTGNSDVNNFAEVQCAIDPAPLPAAPMEWVKDPDHVYLADGGTTRPFASVVTVNRFVEGDLRFNSFDNLDFQPRTRNLYVIEDDTFGEIFACLPDGNDRDLKSDGCVAMLSVVDPSSEPTGFIFDASGTTAYLVLQHGEQPASLLNFTTNPNGGGTDDLLKITGFAVR